MGDAFGVRYGPWAVVAGASEGVGAALARACAARGVHVVLLARRQAVLDEVAASIRAETGVEARAVAVDLAGDDAMERIVAATADVEVGLVAYCAGPIRTTSRSWPTTSRPRWRWCGATAPSRCRCATTSPGRWWRGAGVGSCWWARAGLVGAPNMVAYGASKAFDMVLGEALWAECTTEGSTC